MGDYTIYAREPKVLAEKLMWESIYNQVETCLSMHDNPTDIALELIGIIEQLDYFMKDNADPLDRNKFQDELKAGIEKALAFKGLPCIGYRGQRTLMPEIELNTDNRS